MDITNQGDLSIEKPREYPVVEEGTYEADYKGLKPFKEDGQWGHKEGVRLQFQIVKGPFAKQFVSFKGNFFQDQQSGKWVIGRKSKLADAIRIITGGENINKGHEGTRVYVVVTVNTTKTGPNAGKRYSNVSQIIAPPKDYVAQQAAPTSATQPARGVPPALAQQPAPTPAPTPAPAPQAQPAQAPMAQPAKNKDLLDELSDLSDFGN